MGGAALVAGFVLWRLVLTQGYQARGRELVARAGRLPREYTVGEGRLLRMVVLGDSTAAGVGASSLEATLPYRVAVGLGGTIRVTNLAVSGATLGDVVADQLPRVPQNADLLLVSATANDATKGRSPSDVQDDLRRLIQGLTERGTKRIVLSTTPNFRTTPALPVLMNRLFGRRAEGMTLMLRRMAVREPNVRLADLYHEGTLSEEQYAADGFHPNDAGYTAWAEVFLLAVRQR